ncbi:sensor histidine kinase [Nocardiopsis composta]|uniref:histidine kinase n=1 Tax=Nocardiopsis composta TaxID=157465 RepID=A0A7W8QQB4_9ACTN|nr:sensor histidine kinase [Nocardiopsis composta]MBB5433938.1 signal transduction histidine kinase [Nocardiopsis composta]
MAEGRPEDARPWSYRLTGRRLNIACAVLLAAALVIGEAVFATARGAAVQPHIIALLLAGSASVAVLDRFPFATSAVVGLTLPLYYVTGATDSWLPWLLLVGAVVLLASARNRAAADSTVLIALAVFAVGELFDFQLWRALAIAAWMAVVLALGEIARSRNAYLREVEERAAEAERTREEEGRRRATEERMRIARELHDVIAHNISLINVQAAAAAHRRDPDRAYAALDAIKDTSKETLREVRATLGVLRQVDEDGGGGAPVEPAPTADRIGELVEAARRAGLDARLTVQGEPAQESSAQAGLAAYRIVQEALTNVRRHAGASSVRVVVGHAPGELSVEVADDGTGGAAPPAEGNGLRGMRERAAALGGGFTAGPRPGGGFLVRAVLPAGGADTTPG